MKKILCFGIVVCLAFCFTLPVSAADTIEYYQFGDVNFPLPPGWPAQMVDGVIDAGYSIVLVENETYPEQIGETPQRIEYFLYVFAGDVSIEYEDGHLYLYNRNLGDLGYSVAYWDPDDMEQSRIDIWDYTLLPGMSALSGPLASENHLVWYCIDGVVWPNTSMKDTLNGVGQAVQGVIGWVGQVVPTITEYPGFIMMIAVPLCVGIVTWVTTIYKRRRG